MSQEYFPCVYETCNKRFVRKGYLKVHLENVHHMDKEKAHRCAYGDYPPSANKMKTVTTDCRQNVSSYYPDVEDIDTDNSSVVDEFQMSLDDEDMQFLLDGIARDV